MSTDNGNPTAGVQQATKKQAPPGSHFFSKAEIMKADDIGYEDVPVPEWGVGYVRVRALTAAERSKLEATTIVMKRDGSQQWDGSKVRQLFCVYSIIDPNTGVRMFTDAEVDYIGSKSAAATDRVYESAARQSRFTKEDMQELEGNSPTAPSDASSGGLESGTASTPTT